MVADQSRFKRNCFPALGMYFSCFFINSRFKELWIVFLVRSIAQPRKHDSTLKSSGRAETCSSTASTNTQQNMWPLVRVHSGQEWIKWGRRLGIANILLLLVPA